MKVIRDNIVGLFRFVILLFSVFLLPTRKRDLRQRDSPETPSEEGTSERKIYETLLGSPSEPLLPAETKFCPICHFLVARVRHTKRGTEIIQHGKVLVTVGGNVTIAKDGKRITGFPIKCPNGHTVRIE